MDILQREKYLNFPERNLTKHLRRGTLKTKDAQEYDEKTWLKSKTNK